jgi:isoaspartyl peptidase/L-asparaginase-like protein (Ntn-hydrolase superfamily)
LRKPRSAMRVEICIATACDTGGAFTKASGRVKDPGQAVPITMGAHL